MAPNVKFRFSAFLIVLLVILTACSQTPEPTTAPTLEPTVEVAEELEPTAKVEVEVVEKTILINSEALVDNYIVQKKDEAVGEIEIVVQGSLSNSCLQIEEATAMNKGDVFLINIQTSLTEAEVCEEGAFPFQEIVTLDTQGLSAGSYLISSGAVERFELTTEAAAVDVGEATASDEAAAPEDPAADEGGDTAGEGDTSGGTTADEPAAADTTTDPAGTGECEDYATFLADVTYPDNTVVQAGETFTKTWEIRNDGGCTWGSGYGLVGVSGEFLEVTPVEDPFPTVEPSEAVELSLILTAPQDLGVTSGAWVIERADGGNVQIQNGENFDLWAIVVVGQASAADIVSPVITVNEARVLKDGVVCAEANADYDNQVLALINAARTNNGLPAYQVNVQLSAAARALTSDMACNDFIDHTGSDGSSWFDRIAAQEYVYVDASENIYYGFSGVPEKAFNWWMDSSIHRGNILNSELTEIGIAFALNPQNGGSYYTLVFALPEVEE